MSVGTFDPKAALVKVTDSARAHFAKMLNSSDNKLIRLSTKVSGCSGYAYVLDSVQEKKDNDLEVSLDDGTTILVAADAVPLVQDTEIDYVQVGINGEIRFNNPNVVSECGCGESFNVG
jgi:Fe-S cluster assembly protein SufA/iron-sulfur cluster assembly protein